MVDCVESTSFFRGPRFSSIVSRDQDPHSSLHFRACLATSVIQQHRPWFTAEWSFNRCITSEAAVYTIRPAAAAVKARAECESEQRSLEQRQCGANRCGQDSRPPRSLTRTWSVRRYSAVSGAADLPGVGTVRGTDIQAVITLPSGGSGVPFSGSRPEPFG